MARELDYLTVQAQVQVQVRGGWREWRLGFAFRGRDKTRQAGDETGMGEGGMGWMGWTGRTGGNPGGKEQAVTGGPDPV